MLTFLETLGTGRSVRDHLASAAERGGSRCAVGLGRACLHHRKGQSHKAVVERKAGLEKALGAIFGLFACTSGFHRASFGMHL